MIVFAGTLLLAEAICEAESLSKLAAALDIESSYVITQGYVKYAYDEDGRTIYDENDNPVIKKQNTESYWTVQSKTEKGTSPYSGNSCIRSTLGSRTPNKDTDNTCAYLKVSVFGPGKFSFAYKTATDSDVLNVYVDGKEEGRFSGYGTDIEWEEFELDIPGGANANGSYQHEIMFEFLKSEPSFWDGKYDKTDGPQEEPKWEDYAPEKPYTSEELAWAKEDYNAAKAEYDSFYNCVWLDAFQWTPDELRLAFEQGDMTKEYTDYVDVRLDTNAWDFGYLVKYTTDGSEPNGNSQDYYTIDDDGIRLENNIWVDTNQTVRVKIFKDNKTAYSPATSIAAQISIKASAPAISKKRLDDGGFNVTLKTQYLVKTNTGDDDTIEICVGTEAESIEHIDKNAIYYTLDGSNPTEHSLKYNPEQGIDIHDACEIRAFACRDGVRASDVVSARIEKVAQPTIVVKNSSGKEEPYMVYTGSKGMQVGASSEDGSQLQYSLDSGETYVDFSDKFTLKATAGEKTATAFVRSVSEGKIYSSPVSVTVYPASDAFALTSKNDTGGDGVVLKTGWNLVSFPVWFPATILSYVVSTYQPIGYDAQGKQYVYAETLKPGEAYWIFIRQPIGTSNLQGVLREISYTYVKGWHIYGAGKTEAVPETVTAWEYASGRFKTVQQFVKGHGYIVYGD